MMLTGGKEKSVVWQVSSPRTMWRWPQILIQVSSVSNIFLKKTFCYFISKVRCSSFALCLKFRVPCINWIYWYFKWSFFKYLTIVLSALNTFLFNLQTTITLPTSQCVIVRVQGWAKILDLIGDYLPLKMLMFDNLHWQGVSAGILRLIVELHWVL